MSESIQKIKQKKNVFSRKMIIITAVFVVLSMLFPAGVFGWSDWRTLKTEHFTVFYKPGYESQAWEALRALEYYRPGVEKLTGNQAFHLPVVIEDAGTMPNGMANPLFFNIHLFTYPPPGISALGSVENWWTDVGVHEYIHMLHLTKTAGIPKLLTTLLGTPSPNIFSPGWIAEGITVYGESQISKFQGRLNDGFFDAYLGASVKDNRLPSLPKATYSPMEFPGGSGIYLYGGEFFNYLSKTYGEEKFAQFFKTCGSSILSYFSPILPSIGLDRAAKKVYGKSFPALWREWHKYETERFKDFAMEGERLTSYGWYMEDLRISEGRLYYKRSYPVKTGAFRNFWFSEIMERDLTNGKERAIIPVTSFFTMPMRIHNGRLYYAVAETKFGYANALLSTSGYYSIIHEKDLPTGENRVVFGEEMRAFDVLSDGNILYSKDKKEGFGSEIYLYERATKEKKILFNTDYLVGEIISDGKRIVVSARKDWANFSLYTLVLETGEFTPLVRTPYLECGISLYGDKLFFGANYEKKYSAYCYDFSTGKVSNLTQNGFATFPAYDEKEGMLYFVGLNSYGNDLYRKQAEPKEFQLPADPATKPPVFTLKESEVRRGGYFDNLKTLTPKIRIPLFSFDRDNAVAGIWFMGGDAIGHFPEYTGQFLYNFKKNKPEFSINLFNNFFAPLLSSIKYSTIKEKSLKFDLRYPFISRLSPGLSEFFLGSSLNFFKDFSRLEIEPFLSIAFQYPRTYGSLQFRLPVEQKGIGSSINRTGLYADMELVRYLPNSEISLKIQGIYDIDNPDTVFSEIRGYEQPLEAKSRAIFTLEYSRPILRIRKGLWNPNIFFEDLCVKLFVDGAAGSEGKSQLSTGFELHLETKILSLLSLDIGIGLAVNRERETVPIVTVRLAR